MKYLLLLAIVGAAYALPTVNDVVPEDAMAAQTELMQDDNKAETAFPWTKKCTAGTGDTDAPNVFVSPSGNDYSDKWRGTEKRPYKTLAFAWSRVIADDGHHRKEATGNCVTINLMEGEYTNSDFGKEGGGDEFILDMDGVQDLILKSHDATTGSTTGQHKVVMKFDGPGGFVGGSTEQPVSDFEMYGFEIAGPSESITFEEANADRVSGNNKFKGPGMAIWRGWRIHMHNMKVHHTPGAGLRVNNGDYLVVEDSEVYSTTWWSRSAESAIVFAQAANIDDKTDIKIIMRNNKVYDNMNKVPYYNPNYAWNKFPIGQQYCDASQQATQTEMDACESLYKFCGPEDQSCCTDTAKVWACPWQCRYGKLSQDYVTDGQGVYVTRNSDTYKSGSMELSGNIAYENGINGLVYHRTHNGYVKKNVIWNNGKLPRDDHEESVKCDQPSDADCFKIPLMKSKNPGKPKTQRQPYSGLTLSNSKNIKIWSNTVKAAYADDKSYEFELDAAYSGNSEYGVKSGGNNKNCQGKLSGVIEPYVTTVEKDTSTYSKNCDDTVLNQNKADIA